MEKVKKFEAGDWLVISISKETWDLLNAHHVINENKPLKRKTAIVQITEDLHYSKYDTSMTIPVYHFIHLGGDIWKSNRATTNLHISGIANLRRATEKEILRSKLRDIYLEQCNTE